MTRRKKIIIIIAFILVAIIFGYLIYIIIQPEAAPWAGGNANANKNANAGGILPNANAATNKPIVNANTNAGALPVDNVARGDKTLVEQVVDQSVEDVSLSSDGRTLAYYDASTGQFYKLLPGSDPQLLTSDIYRGAETVTFSPGSDKAIIEFPDGSNIMYDFAKDKQYTLPKEMEDFTFSSSGDRIAFKFMGVDELQRWYATSSPDGSQIEAIDLLGENGDKVTMSWSPEGNIVGWWWEAAAGLKLNIKFLGLHDENLASTMVEGIGFNGQWSPKGDKLLYSVGNQSNGLMPELWVVDASPSTIGQNRTSYKINTWADKCVFTGDEKEIYCAVPRDLETGSLLAREVADDNIDDIYKIDIETGSKQKVAIPVDENGTNDFNIEQLMIDENGENLYFVDKDGSNINKIKLK